MLWGKSIDYQWRNHLLSREEHWWNKSYQRHCCRRSD